jgi:hypothetical protein
MATADPPGRAATSPELLIAGGLMPAALNIDARAATPVMPAQAGIHDLPSLQQRNRVGTPLAERPSHTTGRTDRVPRRFPTRLSAA